jgi:hypothetical protein
MKLTKPTAPNVKNDRKTKNAVIRKNTVFCNKPLLRPTKFVDVVKKEAVNPVGPKRSITPLSSD